jgi:hypothetical protein
LQPSLHGGFVGVASPKGIVRDVPDDTVLQSASPSAAPAAASARSFRVRRVSRLSDNLFWVFFMAADNCSRDATWAHKDHAGLRRDQLYRSINIASIGGSGWRPSW